jgi:hypothetical protein
MFAQSEFKLFQASEITKDSLDTVIKMEKNGIFLQMLVKDNYFSYNTVPCGKATSTTTTTTTTTPTTTTTTTPTTITSTTPTTTTTTTTTTKTALLLLTKKNIRKYYCFLTFYIQY